MIELPEEGFLSEAQIIGCRAVTPAEAEANRKRGRGPRTARPEIIPIIPASKSLWASGVKSGDFPAPTARLGRKKVWSVEVIRKFLRDYPKRPYRKIPPYTPHRTVVEPLPIDFDEPMPWEYLPRGSDE